MQIIDENHRIIKERRSKCPKSLIGLAGEHLACAILCRLGLSTTLYPHGTKNVDLSTTNLENFKQMVFQIKTLRKGHQFFLNGKKPKERVNFYFIFIEFFNDPKKIPAFYIIPSKKVISEGKWDATIPYFNINRKHDQYKNNWSPILKYFFGSE